MPFAILRSIAQAPGRAGAIGRAVPPILGAMSNQVGNMADKSYASSAEAMRAFFNDPHDLYAYGTGTFSAPIRTLASAFADLGGNPRRYPAYGGLIPQAWLHKVPGQNIATNGLPPWEYLATNAPYASYLEMLGYGAYGKAEPFIKRIENLPEQYIRQSLGFYRSKVPNE